LQQVNAKSTVGLNDMSMDMSAFANGTYLIQVLADLKLVHVSKVQKSN
jgi:hypothetical protein